MLTVVNFFIYKFINKVKKKKSNFVFLNFSNRKYRLLFDISISKVRDIDHSMEIKNSIPRLLFDTRYIEV